MLQRVDGTVAPPDDESVRINGDDDGGRYSHLSRESLIALLQRRDRERARVGLSWAANKAERDRSLNDDFVALRLVPELCDGAGLWQNLVIEGDNFDALRWLRLTMRNQVKCIFVDPPYNTGKQDWAYNDAYRDPSDPYHDTTWLEFLHRRFRLANDLLSDDGVMFVCINDEKRSLVELMLDQTLPGMKIGSMVWRTRAGTRGEGAYFSGDHEHLLVYAGPKFRFGGTAPDLNKYANADDDPRGPWVSVALQKSSNFRERKNSYFPVQHPTTGYWYPCNPNRVWSFQKREQESARGLSFEDLVEKRLLLFSRPSDFEFYKTREELDAAIVAGTAHPYIRADLPDLDFWVGRPIARGSVRKKQFLSELKTSTKPFSSWIRGAQEIEEDENIVFARSGLYQEGTNQLRELMRADVFAHPKPVSLVRELVRQSTARNDVVLDFFAGSGTTAQAVIELNAEDNLCRRFVMISHDEATADHPNRNLTRDVLAERVRRLSARTLAAGGEPASFAYLRTRQIPADRIQDGVPDNGEEDLGSLLPADVWLAVQARHGLPLTPYSGAQPIQIAENDTGVVAFCDQVTEAAIECLRGISTRHKSIHCYAWTPGPVRRALEGVDAEVHRVPNVLWQAFKS